MPVATMQDAAVLNEKFTLDDAQFRAKIPFELTTTSLKGVYLHTAPPDDFDPNTASASDLIKHGIMVRRPTAQDPPALQKAWNAFFSRKWLAKDRIVPEFEVHVGKTHNLKQPAQRQGTEKGANTSFTSNAWAGPVTETGKWTTCIGTWTIPTVSKPAEAQGTEGGWNSSSWVGIDGFNTSTVSSNDVLQAGIEQKVDAHGNASYFAWYEWFAPAKSNSPAYIYEVGIPNMPVKPGQQVSCTVQYVGTTSGTLTFANNTTGAHFSITLAPPPGADFKGNTCEWIMEAPDGGEPKSSLPKFTPVVFTAAIACGPNGAVTNPSTGDITNIRNASGTVLTSTSVGTDTCTISFIG